jgi:hypothetical protein
VIKGGLPEKFCTLGRKNEIKRAGDPQISIFDTDCFDNFTRHIRNKHEQSASQWQRSCAWWYRRFDPREGGDGQKAIWNSGLYCSDNLIVFFSSDNLNMLGWFSHVWGEMRVFFGDATYLYGGILSVVVEIHLAEWVFRGPLSPKRLHCHVFESPNEPNDWIIAWLKFGTSVASENASVVNATCCGDVRICFALTLPCPN